MTGGFRPKAANLKTKVFMKKILYIAILLLSVTQLQAQSRANQITRNCGDTLHPPITAPAKVLLGSDGSVTINTCWQQTLTISDPRNNPWPSSGLQWSSLNGLAYNGTAYFDGGDLNIFGGLQIGATGGTATPNLYIGRTITSAGTTGNVTIDKLAGTVNIAAGAGTAGVTVTNARVTANSIVFAVARTNDATCSVKNVVPAAGSFVLRTTANCTAETSFGFFVTN